MDFHPKAAYVGHKEAALRLNCARLCGKVQYMRWGLLDGGRYF